MNDKISKLILLGILICLIFISIKPITIKNQVSFPSPSVSVGNDFISISPGIIGIKDNGSHTGYEGQLLIFEYDLNSNTFKFISSLNYEDYINHPEKYGIPIKK